MLVRGPSCQDLQPSAETVTLSRSQVCIRKLAYSSCTLCQSTGLGIGPFAPPPSKPQALVTRAAVLTCRCKAQSTPSFHQSATERSRSKATQRLSLQSLKEALKQHSPDDDLHSHDENPSQGSERFKGSLHQHAESPSKRDVGLEQQRLPVQGTFKVETGQKSPSSNQPPPDDASSAAPSGSAQTGSKFSSTRNRDVRPSKRRSSRISARGLDVLDELMASQGRSSRALLESLQSTAASDDEDWHWHEKDNLKAAPHKHWHEKDNLKAYSSQESATQSSSGKVFRNRILEGNQGIPSEIVTDTWKPISNSTMDEGVKSNIFASSIEKALFPPPSDPTATSSSLASSSKVRVLDQRSSSSSNEAYSDKVSDVAKPTLRGQEVLLALQMAAIEKAKLKQRTRKVSARPSKAKEDALVPDSGAWRNAKPIVVKPEWALQIEELERRIETLRDPMPSS